MRVTNNMMSTQFLSGYQTSLSRMSDIQEKIIASKNINRPSDNPVGAARNLQFTAATSANELFTQNANDAISWMQTSDTNLSGIVTTMTNIKTAVSSAISANPTSSYDAIAKQIDQMINELVLAGNAQIGGRYVFSGQSDSVEPFTRNETTGVVTYNGTYNGQSGAADTKGTITMQIVPGDINTSRDKINLDGSEVFGAIDATGTPKIFQDLLTIKQHLEDIQTGANGVTPDTLSNDLGTIDADMDYIISAQTTIGARQKSYQTISERLIVDASIIATDATNNDGYNVAKASIESQLAQNAYNSLLSVGANVLPKSLVDYL
ncbi:MULTISPECIES: flagellin [Pelosinus]|uniref:Flagellin domain protein n=1 Tax=Pelosinus fermentans B4 TaxID=1149862 RepID=I9LK63_9FIRM|nr:MULTISPECIES: flagellin [Pelosinus]EIW20909.1 flagellin domain protein [Pelosinus fermentans B4]EIW27224.1 flagellar hook-associated protein 3 [Pelosinus fermentans A11]